VANTVTITVDADTKKAEKSVKGMGTKFRSAMKGVAMAAGGLTLAAGAAAKLGQEYQEATNTIRAGTGASGEQLEGLTQSFKDVWGTVPQDAAEVSSAIADVNTELGLEGAALEDVTRAFLDVSRAMGEEAGPMIKAVADSMVAFGVPASETRSQLDKLTAVSQAVGVPMSALASTIVKFGPQLQTMGLGLDEATALVGNMEAAGLSASKMMPGLNTAVQKLAKEGVTDISAGLRDMISNIENAETDTEALAIATDIFGAGAGLRFKDAIDKGVFALDDMLEAMGNSEGKVADLGAETLTMSDKFDIMKNRLKGALAPIGQFATALGPIVIMAPAIATGISAMAASQTIATAATWLQATAMAALNLALGPIGLIIIGIVLAIAGIVLAIKNWDKITRAFASAWSTVWNNIRKVFDFVMGVLDTKIGKILAFFLPFGPIIVALKLLSENWDAIWNGMKATVSLVVDGIRGYVNLLISALNLMIRGANKISIKVPSWVPGIGGKGFSLDIPEIPSLAAGGIVTKPTLAMLGERGPEAVVPLGRSGMGGITINILGPTYGFDDFERRVGEAIRDGVRRGGFGGILATA
jgi:TP901 family phage tail tape measure protein